MSQTDQPNVDRPGADPGPGEPQVRRDEPVPESSRRLCTLAAVDYADSFTIDRGVAERTPEDWGRTMFEDILGDEAQFVWRRLMWLRLAQAPDRLAGWAIAGRGPGWLRMEARGRAYRVQLVIRADAGVASLATFLQYDWRLAGPIWRVLSRTHRSAAPGLLRDAYAALS